MKIQVIFTSSFPIGNAGTNRTHYICKGLVESGASVELLITNPTETFTDMRNLKSKGVYEKVAFRYINDRLKRDKNKAIRKIVDIWCHIMTILQVFRNQDRFDYFIVIGTSVDFRAFLPFSKLFNGAKILLEINEYPFVTRESNIITKIKRFFLLEGIFPLYDGFIVISTPLNNLVNRYKSRKAFSLIMPILGDCSEIRVSCRSPLKDPYIIHTGSVVESKDGIIGILKAFKISIDRLKQPIKLVITGDVKGSTDYKMIADFISRNQLSDFIIFTGFLASEELERYLMNGSLAIINKSNNRQNRFCFPTKLADYIKYEVPLIVTSVGESITYLKDGLNAYIIEPEDINSLASKIIYVIENPKQSKAMAKYGKSLVEKEFNYFYQGQRLFNFLKALINE